MKSSSAFNYLLSFSPVPLVIVGNLSGGAFTMMNAFYGLVIMIFSEGFLPENKNDNHASPLLSNLILFLHPITLTACVISFIYGIHSGIISGGWILTATVSTGLNSGMAGITSAHELIHRKEKVLRALGICNLVLVNYGHFYIEHIKCHHKLVGTKKDPATALYGETVYHFFFRTVPQQFLSSIQIESTRLEKENKSSFSMRNFVLMITSIEIVICILLFYFFGKTILLAFLLQSFIAIFLLEYTNYIEHYGLERNENERVNATHSWQSDFLLSRFSLLELSRHSDHHYYASKPYHTLKSYDESPVLPSGYFGSFYTALIPPLWFKKINPIIDRIKISS
ncbi:alkane 1-monooxygenase [Bacteroidota bacterium]|nr:alkane 1-monooxygenase [Bacteroidota bacterium]